MVAAENCVHERGDKMIKKKCPFLVLGILFFYASCGFIFSQEKTFSMSAGAGGVFSSVLDIEKVHNSTAPYVTPAAGFNIFLTRCMWKWVLIYSMVQDIPLPILWIRQIARQR
jgi:hypothetical protein